MLNTLIDFYIKDLKRHSLSLVKTSILIEKPWTLIDDDDEIQKLIFKKNKDLILSKNGNVTEGKWDYFPDANSLLIDRGSDKILCNEVYIDDAAMILKRDGTNNQYFILANQNLIPDLNVISYLENIRRSKFHIIEFFIDNDRKVEILKNPISFFVVEPGDNVNYAGTQELVEDGFFKIRDKKEFIEIKNSIIHKRFFEIEITFDNKQTVVILINTHLDYSIGDIIYKDKTRNEYVNDGEYYIRKTYKFIVEKGKIIKIFKRNSILGFAYGSYGLVPANYH